MSWVNAVELDSHLDDLRDEPVNLDLQWESPVDSGPHDILFNNLEVDPDEQPFLFSVLIRDKIYDPSEDADSFFSDTEITTHLPILMVFASRDERLVGRCVTVQRVGVCIAVTIVHSDIEIYDVTSCVHVEGMDRFHMLANNLSTLEHPGIRSIFDFSLKDFGMLVALKIKHIVTTQTSEVDYLREEGNTYGAAPDLAALFADARGPVQQVEDVPSGIRYAATLMGGLVAVMRTGEDYAYETRDAFIKSLGVRVVFIASHHDTHELELSWAHMSIKEYDGDEHKTVYIHTRGVSMMHLAHVIGPACDLANEHYHKNPPPISAYFTRHMVRLLEDGCDWRTQETVDAHQQEILNAKAVFARTINRNLERIKAHLWRPTGRLAATMTEGWQESV